MSRGQVAPWRRTGWRRGAVAPNWLAPNGAVAPNAVEPNLTWLRCLAQARLPTAQPLDGSDLMPLFTGRGKLLPRPLFWHFPVYIQATVGIQGPWRATPTTVMRLGDYKLFDHFEYRRFQLYDLRIDEGERDDLSTRYPELARHLHARMLRWRHRVKAPLPGVR